MKGKPGCPRCGGRGVILDPDPMVPAAACSCLAPDAEELIHRLPKAYKTATLDSFLQWWKGHGERTGQTEMALRNAYASLEASRVGLGIPESIQMMIQGILDQCGVQMTGMEQFTWKTLGPAIEPNNYRMLSNWAIRGMRPMRNVSANLFWICGEPISGKGFLASAAARAWCEREGRTGLFISCRELRQDTRDIYNDILSFRNKDFVNERDLMEPLLESPMLVLDDIDLVGRDTRILGAICQILDHRNKQELPTILTAGHVPEISIRRPDRLQVLLDIGESSLMARMSTALRVELVPTIVKLMEPGIEKTSALALVDWLQQMPVEHLREELIRLARKVW